MAVNVTARQIRRGLKGQVDTALTLSGVNPQSLEIEITEHSMVEDIDSNVAQLAALRSLGLVVVAEGIETEAQRVFLTEQGCDCAQGFLYSHAITSDAVSELLQRHARPGPVWPAPSTASGRPPLRLA